GAKKGKFYFVLDSNRLVASQKVVPNRPEESPLYKRMQDQTTPMPPEGEMPRPSEADIKDIRLWIEAAAPDLPPVQAARVFIPESKIFQTIRDDLEGFDPSKRPSLRYFTITHLYNAGLSEDDLQVYRLGLAKLVNSLSSGPRVVVPEPIGLNKTVFRIDLRDYRWDKKAWEQVMDAYPYGVVSASEAAKSCYEQTQCKVPCVRADWFVATASRPPLYHTLLQLPATSRELEHKLQIDDET